MATPVRSFFPHVLSRISGCPELLAQLEIVSAAIEFCDRTKIVRPALQPIDISANLALYPLNPPEGHRVITVIRATIDGHPLTPTSENELDLQWPHRREFWPEIHWASENTWTPWREYREATPSLYYMPDPNSIRLVGIPTGLKPGALGVTVAVKPLPSAKQLEDVLYTDWFEAIANGALARLYAMSDRPWASATLANHHRALFQEAIREAEGRAARDYMRDDRTVLRTKAYYR